MVMFNEFSAKSFLFLRLTVCVVSVKVGETFCYHLHYILLNLKCLFFTDKIFLAVEEGCVA